MVKAQSFSVALVELPIENGQVVKALRILNGNGRVVKALRFSMALVRFSIGTG